MTGTKGQHRVEAVQGSQHVRVEIDGQVVARSGRPVLVYETGLPVRYYLPPEDVDLSLFEQSASHTTCPFKGVASYWSFRGTDTATAVSHPDVAWAYPDPLPAVELIRGCLSFYDNVADITVEDAAP